jgi:hypothetical protein
MTELVKILDSIKDSINANKFPVRYPTLEEHTWYNKNMNKISAIINDADERNKELIFFFKCYREILETKGYIQDQKKNLIWQGGHPMLHTNIYNLVSGLVKKMTNGTILEIGTYSGGITVNTALALHKNSNNQNIDFIAVEVGAKYDDNQTFNGKDQYYYCTQNLASAVGIDLWPYVDYIQGDALDKQIESKLQQLNPIELLIIDANGQVTEQLERYLPYCANGCILVIDDYWTIPKWDMKGPTVRVCINKLVDEGILKVVSLCDFSTIILIYGDKNTLGELESMPEYGTTKV